MLGLKRNVVQLQNHDSKWRNEFRKEKKLLSEILQYEALSINHIGSTSIPWICAKPILDMAVEVDSFDVLDSLSENLQEKGFIYRPMHDEPGRRLYVKGEADYTTHHVHFFEKDTKELQEHLFFRDYLIENKAVALEYEEIKKKLAVEFPNDREKYTEGKAEYIISVLGQMNYRKYN